MLTFLAIQFKPLIYFVGAVAAFVQLSPFFRDTINNLPPTTSTYVVKAEKKRKNAIIVPRKTKVTFTESMGSIPIEESTANKVTFTESMGSILIKESTANIGFDILVAMSKGDLLIVTPSLLSQNSQLLNQYLQVPSKHVSGGVTNPFVAAITEQEYSFLTSAVVEAAHNLDLSDLEDCIESIEGTGMNNNLLTRLRMVLDSRRPPIVTHTIREGGGIWNPK